MSLDFFQCRFKSSAGYYLRGYTLLEVVITLLVLSIGFLGVAGVQSFSLKQSHNTYFRSQADLLLRDMADRMRHNAQAARLGLYGHEGGASGGDLDACTGSEMECTYEEMAETDLAEWTGNIVNPYFLPQGEAIIESLDEPGAYLITVSWKEKKTRHDQQEGSDDGVCIAGEINQRSCLALRVFIGG